MSSALHHQSLSLQNFTAFQSASFDFVPGINVFVGENGTGKTHVMKAMYAAQLSQSRDARSIGTTLADLFQTQDIADIVRQGTTEDTLAEVKGLYNSHEWSYVILRLPSTGKVAYDNFLTKPARPVFIPAIDMMGHTKGFTEAFDEVRLDFDLTCRDIVNLLRLERKNGEVNIANGGDWSKALNGILNGEIVRDDNGRFYLVTTFGRQPMPLVAEGLRKVATLVQLQKNGWLSPGTTLFWDEPEVNLNPILMDEIVSALFSLVRQNVQIFLATHSYVILKELDLQKQKEDSVRYFAFQPGEGGTKINATEDFALLKPNPILDQYDSLYDRELTRSTGRNRSGERVC